MRLLIVSHTAHYRSSEGLMLGWGPTVREIDQLATLFDEVVHAAPIASGPPPASTITYRASNVRFVALHQSGGSGIAAKVGILRTLIPNLRAISIEAKRTDWFHLRLPTNIGLYILPWLSLRRRPRRWIKYAGNWVQPNPPLSYRMQRFWLKRNWQHSQVTINGSWPSQARHLLSFENPCLDESERSEALSRAAHKNFSGALTLCFVGVLETSKGIEQLISALSLITRPDQLKKLVVVGDGSLRPILMAAATSSPVNVDFRGYLPRHAINDVYAESHVIILPSDSEGFPKVIAEGASYGCIPIVTNVSSLGQYIEEGLNGFLLDKNDPPSIARAIDQVVGREAALPALSKAATLMSGKFTFERYISRIKNEILNS